MSEKRTIENRKTPNTMASLENELRQLGLKAKMTVIVHSSLSSLGWTSGGAVAVVQALMNVLTHEGTLVMPTHSGDLSDPCHWENPPVPEDWWQTIRDTMPAFDSNYTPTRGMGAIVEVFRTFPNVKRSSHPQVSFGAWGKYADKIIENHGLAYGLGKNSPLQKIYDLNGYVLLLGVGHGNNTSLHLAENLAKIGKKFKTGGPIINEHGNREWCEFEDVESDADDFFEDLGQHFEAVSTVLTGKIGNADAKLMNQRELVDFGTEWLKGKMNDEN